LYDNALNFPAENVKVGVDIAAGALVVGATDYELVV
jgi:hypothetical protein